MKRTMILIIMLCCLLQQNMPQKISSIITLQDGRKVTDGYAFLDGDTCTFHVDGNEQKYDWSFALYKVHREEHLIFPNESPVLVEALHSEESAKTFSIYPELINWRYAYNFYGEDGDSSVYFKGMVYLWNEQEKVDSMNVHFNLLPSRAKIIGATFTYTKYDWEYDDFFPNAEFSISFRPERSDGCYIITGDPFYFEFPSTQSYFHSMWEAAVKVSDGEWSVKTNLVDWGQFYCINVFNKYGIVACDTLCSTNYIQDPGILSRLAELEKEASAIFTISHDTRQIRIVFRNHCVGIEGDRSQVQELSVYTHGGILVKKQSGGEDMELSDLVKGCYVVSCRTTENKVIITKIQKQ